MKKIIAGGMLLAAASFFSFAGDSAVLVDNGFSENGKYYIFGQYGRTDKTFQSWAEIYTVDVEKNDFVGNEYYKTKPSSATADKTGKVVYEELAGKNYNSMKKYSCNPAKPDKVLYIRDAENKGSTDEIIFKDFVSSVSKDQAYYHVKLVPTFNGRGSKCKSSFYIMLEKRDADGKVLASQKIGTPSVNRTGVTGYKIERIAADNSGKNIVFIVEKQFEDKTGINIRYMVEAAVLNSDFFANLAESETVEPIEVEVVEEVEIEVEDDEAEEGIVVDVNPIVLDDENAK